MGVIVHLGLNDKFGDDVLTRSLILGVVLCWAGLGLAEPVTFEKAMQDGADGLDGLSLADLINRSPIYPPIKDLPPQVWKDKTCNNCHSWTKDDLCDQGLRYLSSANASMTKLHPYGGTFKRRVAVWSSQGCE